MGTFITNINICFSVAANVANTRNILLKPMECPSTDTETSAEKNSEDQIKQSDSSNTHNLVVPGDPSIPLRLKGLHSNGLDGDLVLHKEDNNYTSSRLSKGQGLTNDDSIDEYLYVESTCLVNVDPLTKSSTIVTHLSSVEEEDDISTNQDIINDDGKNTYWK